MTSGSVASACRRGEAGTVVVGRDDPMRVTLLDRVPLPCFAR
jgi:hypothetical protein